jgi:integrase
MYAQSDSPPFFLGSNHEFDWQDQDYVFTGLKGGPLNPRYILKMFDRVLKEAGLPHMPFHNLRYSAATLLLSMGEDMVGNTCEAC